MEMNKTSRGRVWEIDFLRGIALTLMIIFHLFYDLNEFYGYAVPYNRGIYYLTGKVSGTLFIMISAVSASFSRNNPRRAGGILAAAAVITVVTHIYDPNYGIKFGILHFLGTAVLLYPFFRRLDKYILAFLGTIIIILGWYFDRIPVDNNFLFLFNLTAGSWISADYYPLFPWLGVFLYGISLARFLYPQKKSLLKFTPQRDFLGFLGRHTLVVYLAHQPLLILIIGVVQALAGNIPSN